MLGHSVMIHLSYNVGRLKNNGARTQLSQQLMLSASNLQLKAGTGDAGVLESAWFVGPVCLRSLNRSSKMWNFGRSQSQFDNAH